MDEATRPERTANTGVDADRGVDERGAPAELQARLADLSEWRLIGRGGFASVFSARQTRLGRTVAVKLLNDRPSPQALRSFMRECELLGRLSSHPNIVTVFDAGVTSGDRPFLVMEHLAQGTLAQRVADGGRIDVGEIVNVAAAMASALTTAHRRGVLHLDVKPANILLDTDGAPVLGDFGVARLEVGGTIGTGGNSSSGAVPFSPFYAAPEVLDGQRPTRATDVYGLGATLFTTMAGRPPFWSDDDNQPSAVIARTLQAPLPDLSQRGWPIELVTLVESMLDRTPETRPTLGDVALRLAALGHSASPATASSRAASLPDQQLHQQLDQQRATPAQAPSNAPAARRRPSRPGRRKWPAISLGAAVAITTAAVVAVSSGHSSRPTLTGPTVLAEATSAGASGTSVNALSSASTTSTPGDDAAFPVVTGVRWDVARQSTLARDLIERAAGSVAEASARTLVRAGEPRAVVLRIVLAPSAGVVDDATFTDHVVTPFSPTSTVVMVGITAVHRVMPADGTAVAIFRAPSGEAWFVLAATDAIVDAETAALVAAVGG